MAKQRMPKEMNMVLVIAGIAVVVLVLVGMNSVNVGALSGDGSFVGEALSAFTGKCTQMQKTTCQQLQQRCATVKGTWTGDCSKCVSKCSMPKK